MPEVHDPYLALRQPDYRRLLIGNLLASIATQMQSVAVGWELYQRTNSAEALGLVGLVQFLPVLILFLPAGHAADIYSRRGLLMASQSVMASASLGLAAISFFHLPDSLVYVCLLLVGISQAFNSPVRWALIAQVVSEDALVSAVTWNSSAFQIASVVGPTLGGLVIWASGRAGETYLLAALGSFICASLVFGVRPTKEMAPREPVSLKSLLAGASFVWSTKLILATITLDLFAVLFGGATALLPLYAKDILDVGPSGLGWLRSAPSLGAVAMAMFLAYRPPLQRAGFSLLVSVAGFGLATVIFGLSRNFLLSFLMLVLTGAFDNVSVLVRGTLVQVLTPDAMRGRVSAVNAIFITSSNQLGAFESGQTAHWFGPVVSVVGGGVATVLVVFIVMAFWPEVLALGELRNKKTMLVPDPEKLAVEEAQPPQ